MVKRIAEFTMSLDSGDTEFKMAGTPTFKVARQRRVAARIVLVDHLGAQPRALEIIRVVETPTVTHLQYRVMKRLDAKETS